MKAINFLGNFFGRSTGGTTAGLATILFSIFLISCSPHSKDIPPAALPFLPEASGDVKSYAGPVLQIIYSGHLAGELESCGCSVNPKGGLERRLSYWAQAQAWGPSLVVDAGNSLFPPSSLQIATAKKEIAAAERLYGAYAKLGVQVQNVGSLELALGVDELKRLANKYRVPLVSLNLVDAKRVPLFETHKIVESSGIKVLVTGFSKYKGEGVEGLEPKTALRDLLKKLPSSTYDLVVLLTDLGISESSELLKLAEKPTILINATEFESRDIPLYSGSGLFFESQNKGSKIGQLRLAYRPHTQRWFNGAFQAFFVEREQSLKEKLKSATPKDQAQIEASMRDLDKYRGDPQKDIIYANQMVDLGEQFDKATPKATTKGPPSKAKKKRN